MSQQAKIIDLTRSFIPIDPQVYPDTRHDTRLEDAPEDAPQVVAYEGYNFMPTPGGYRSYFGIASKVSLAALTSRVDQIFVYQTEQFDNYVIALCEDGIWVNKGATAGAAWEHQIALSIPDDGVHLNWTMALIEETLYCYRKGDSGLYKFSPKALSVASHVATPTAVVGLAATYDYAVDSLALGTYEFAVVANLPGGDTSLASDWFSTAINEAGSIKLTWTAYAGATGYQVYKKEGALARVYTVTGTSWDSAHDSFPYVEKSSTITRDNTYPAYTFFKVTPTFLNMEGQEGLFKAGGRLGFWDTENSVAWSSIDDTREFTPSITTLAGSAIFQDVIGRIVTVRPHGEGFIIYATKSIVYIRRNVEATFQWDPLTILTDTGIAYPEECCSATPDTRHFAWTTSGFYDIKEGKAENIAVEVYDYLKNSQDPIFLHMLEGRYLCLEIIDEAYINGKATFTISDVPATTITLPDDYDTSDLLTGLVPIELTGTEVCYTMAGFDKAEGNAAEPDHDPSNPATPPKKPGTFYTPRYRAVFSMPNGAADGITWGPTPCPTVDPNGVEHNLCPVGNSGKLEMATQDATNKIVHEGGTWDSVSFVQAQLAIWRMADSKRAEFLAAILNRAGSGEKITHNLGSCTIAGPTVGDCDLGTYIAGTTSPWWGVNSCSLWLSRLVNRVVDVKRRKMDVTTCSDIPLTAAATIKYCYRIPYSGQPDDISDWIYDTPEAAANAAATKLGTAVVSMRFGINISYHGATPGGQVASPVLANGGICTIGMLETCPVGYTSSPPIGTDRPLSIPVCTTTNWTKTEKMFAHNVGAFREGSFAIETAYLELVGWSYTDTNGQARTLNKSTACVIPTTTTAAAPKPPSPGNSSGNFPADEKTGMMCSKPFNPATLPVLPIPITEWPVQTVTIPASSFLLQKGSIGPIYPLFTGAYVYDTQLKKWGKMRRTYRRLLDYSPINNNSGDIIPFETFGILGGIFADDGYLKLFDAAPDESYITYGRVGNYRLGFTNLEEVRANFGNDATGFLKVEGSLDGKNKEAACIKIEPITGNTAELLANLSARWYNITISGKYDISHLEFRSTKSSRR